MRQVFVREEEQDSGLRRASPKALPALGVPTTLFFQFSGAADSTLLAGGRNIAPRERLLDYAANAVVYWPVERLRATFEAACESDGRDPSEVVLEHLDEGDTVDDFWDKTNTNLRAGNVRLVFVADELPPELQRVIEFLNAQMRPAEVIGIEVRRYVGQGLN